jgi:tripartite-type tricarboxylate transporter receptor subunit TctC
MVGYDDVGAGGHVSIVTMVTYLAKEGAVPKGSTPAELAATMQAELAKWGKVIRSANIKFE